MSAGGFLAKHPGCDHRRFSNSAERGMTVGKSRPRSSRSIPVAGVPPAVRLAKPHSIWARLFYEEQKKARARERYGVEAPAAAAPPGSAAGAASASSAGAGQSSS